MKASYQAITSVILLASVLAISIALYSFAFMEISSLLNETRSNTISECILLLHGGIEAAYSNNN
ncbi:MAG: hypothetical protein DRJ31_11050, partial [Candidatus Methanomethylicota archaeon]